MCQDRGWDTSEFFSNPTSQMSVCSLCNSRICRRHRILNARSWECDRLQGGIQVYCENKNMCFQRQLEMNVMARTFTHNDYFE